MRTLVVAAIALLAGLLIGAWPYRNDLRAARDEVSRLKSDLAKKERARSNIEGITRLLAIPDRETVDVARTTTEPVSAPQSGPDGRTVSNTPSGFSSAQVRRHRWEERRPDPEDFRAHIKQAADLWKTRVALARESFASRVPTNEAQAVRFDVLMEAMNIRLGTTIEKWVDAIKTQEVFTAETGVRMMNELTDAIVVTYDELDRNMPPDWREKAGPEFQLLDFIDPEVAIPLAEIAPKFEGQGPFRPGPRANSPPFADEQMK